MRIPAPIATQNTVSVSWCNSPLAKAFVGSPRTSLGAASAGAIHNAPVATPVHLAVRGALLTARAYECASKSASGGIAGRMYPGSFRSEERRVGKECRARRAAEHEEKTAAGR